VLVAIIAVALTALRRALDREAPPAARHPANPASANQLDRVRITISINSKYVRYTSQRVFREGHFLVMTFRRTLQLPELYRLRH